MVKNRSGENENAGQILNVICKLYLDYSGGICVIFARQYCLYRRVPAKDMVISVNMSGY